MPINFLHPVDKELGKGSGGETNNTVLLLSELWSQSFRGTAGSIIRLEGNVLQLRMLASNHIGHSLDPSACVTNQASSNTSRDLTVM